MFIHNFLSHCIWQHEFLDYVFYFFQSDNKINFTSFTMHMSVGSIFVLGAAYGFVRFLYRKKEFLKSKDPPGVAGMKTLYARVCIYAK